MESDTFTKKYNFRLPDRTIERLDSLIEKGSARNRTEALIFAIDAYVLLEPQISENAKMVEKLTDRLLRIEEEHKFIAERNADIEKSIMELKSKDMQKNEKQA